MKIQNNTSKPGAHRLSLLAGSILLALHTPSAYALQALDDTALSHVNAQDGLVVDLQYDEIQLEHAYWEDNTGLSTNADTPLRGYANDISITGTNLGTTYSVDVNSNGVDGAGIDLSLVSRYGTIAAESFNICDGTGANCGLSLGGLTVQSTENATLAFSTTNGLFNQDSSAEITIGLQNLNIYISQADATIRNQFILKDLNFNFFGQGALWVDGENGLQLAAVGAGNYVDLLRVDDLGAHASVVGAEKPGLNLELMYKGGVAPGVFDTTGAKGLLRLGASGRAIESSLVFRGIDATNTGNNNLLLGYSFSGADMAGTGADATVMGSTGLALRMVANFTNEDNAAGGEEFTLELAHAGTNAYGFEFSNLKPLRVRTVDGGGSVSLATAYLDTGNVYLNLGNTKRLQMPVNTVLNTTRFANKTPSPADDFITTTPDYSHLVHNTATNPNSVIAAVRGMEFQAVSRRGRFLISNDVPLGDPGRTGLNDATTNDWGLGLPIYNLNANLAVFGAGDMTTQRTGFSLGLSTQGINYDRTLTPAQNATLGNDGSKTTSIMLIDAEDNPFDGNNPTSRYVGLRNIDMLITAYGEISLEDDKININMPKLLIAASFEVAAGYLPGARYRTELFTGCTATETACYVPVNNFTSNRDVAFGVNLKLEGSMNLDLIPGDNSTLATNRIDFRGRYQLTNGAVQIVEPTDGSILGLDNISGRIDFDNHIKINHNSVDFNVKLDINQGAAQATTAAAIGVLATNALRIKDVNLYPGNSAIGQRLGEIAIPGGTLTTQLNIIPR